MKEFPELFPHGKVCVRGVRHCGTGPREFDPVKLRERISDPEPDDSRIQAAGLSRQCGDHTKTRDVVCALCDYYEEFNANVHRSVHYLAGQATERFEEARKKIAAFIGAPNERGVIFTRGTTEGVNLVASAWGRKFVQAGRRNHRHRDGASQQPDPVAVAGEGKRRRPEVRSGAGGRHAGPGRVSRNCFRRA